MVMDADTTLTPGSWRQLSAGFADDRALMAVGGLFYGEAGHGLIGQFQRNEYSATPARSAADAVGSSC